MSSSLPSFRRNSHRSLVEDGEGGDNDDDDCCSQPEIPLRRPASHQSLTTLFSLPCSYSIASSEVTPKASGSKRAPIEHDGGGSLSDRARYADDTDDDFTFHKEPISPTTTEETSSEFLDDYHEEQRHHHHDDAQVQPSSSCNSSTYTTTTRQESLLPHQHDTTSTTAFGCCLPTTIGMDINVVVVEASNETLDGNFDEEQPSSVIAPPRRQDEKSRQYYLERRKTVLVLIGFLMTVVIGMVAIIITAHVTRRR